MGSSRWEMSREWLSETLNSAKAHGAHHWQRAKKQRIRIGVAGLSRAGKSSFITSLVRQLQAHDESDLLSFSPALEGRIESVEVIPPDKTRHLSYFQYSEYLSALQASPSRFPDSTVDVSGVDVEIYYRSRRGKRRKLTVEITDFPGEWLIDLAMLGMTYDEWNRWQCRLWESRERYPEFVSLSQDIFKADYSDDAALTPLKLRYQKLLQDTRQGEEGALLQPGQLCTARHQVDRFPMACTDLLDSDENHTLRRWMASEYEAYISHYVAPFFESYLQHIDRQVVLVDVQEILLTNDARFDETSEALSLILGKFDYSESHTLLNWLRPKVDKTCFYATKADRVLPEDHSALRKILQRVGRDAIRYSKANGAAVVVDAISAICTTTPKRVSDGDVLQGFDEEGKPLAYQNPSLMQDDELCYALNHEFIAPTLVPIIKGGIPTHIRLDSALEQLLSDWME